MWEEPSQKARTTWQRLCTQICDFPSPKITAAFPFVNISAQICHSFGRKQFANSPEMKNKGVTATGSSMISISSRSVLRQKGSFFIIYLFKKFPFSVLSITSYTQESKTPNGICSRDRPTVPNTPDSYGSLSGDMGAKFHLIAANKWSQIVSPTLTHVYSHVDVLNRG